MVNSILILTPIVLPGWVSISAARRYHPRVVERTALMVWGMMFYHAAVVHVIGVGAVTALALTWRGHFVDNLGLDRVLTDGAAEFAQDSPGTALAAFGAYFLWTVVGAIVSGVADLPFKLTYAVGWAAQKIGLASEPVGEETVWHSALNLGGRQAEKSSVQVFVQMKNGGVYIGNLVSYPVDLPDSAESKDIMLGSCAWHPNGDGSSRVDMKFDHDEGGVLLNTANIYSYSVHYRFFDDDGDADGESAGGG